MKTFRKLFLNRLEAKATHRKPLSESSEQKAHIFHTVCTKSVAMARLTWIVDSSHSAMDMDAQSLAAARPAVVPQSPQLLGALAPKVSSLQTQDTGHVLSSCGRVYVSVRYADFSICVNSGTSFPVQYMTIYDCQTICTNVCNMIAQHCTCICAYVCV
jgi:hypothetical protein